MQYDNVISLGTNCEVSFRCANYYKDYSTFPFSWVQINDLDKFLLALDDLEGMYKGSYHFDKDLIVFEKYNIGFHLRNKNGEMINSYKEIESLDYSLKELDSRMKHLIDKWDSAKKDKNAFIQYFVTKNHNNIHNYITNLYNTLDSIFNDFTLFIVVKKEIYRNVKIKKQHNIHIHYVRKCPKREEISNPKYSDRVKWLLILRNIKKGNAVRYLYSCYPTIGRLFHPLLKLKHSLSKKKS